MGYNIVRGTTFLEAVMDTYSTGDSTYMNRHKVLYSFLLMFYFIHRLSLFLVVYELVTAV